MFLSSCLQEAYYLMDLESVTLIQCDEAGTYYYKSVGNKGAIKFVKGSREGFSKKKKNDIRGRIV